MYDNFFIGTQIEGDLATKIVHWQKQQEHFDLKDIHWVPPESFHVTFVPPWSDTADSLEEIFHKFQTGIRYWRIKKFNITFDTIQQGPDFNMPKFIMATGPEIKELSLSKEIFSFDLRYWTPPEQFYPYIPLATLSGNLTSNFINAIDWTYIVHKIIFYKTTDDLNEVNFEIIREFDLDQLTPESRI